MRSTDSLDDRVKQVMADVLDLDAEQIDDSTAMDSVDSWDSLTHINLCMALEQEFQVSFEVSEMESMLSYTDVLAVLQDKI